MWRDEMIKMLKRREESNQLLGENKLYSLNSTYNFCALKNLQFRFQEKILNLNREEHLNGKSARLVIWRSEVRIPVQIQNFLLKSKL